MPFPNEHSCRHQPPTKYKSFRRVNKSIKVGNKKADAIFGILTKKGKRTSELQAVRFPISRFTTKEARKWCKDHKGSFEKATGAKNQASVVFNLSIK